MTRINIGIPPRKLHPRHLLAEYREITRIPNAILRGNFNLNNLPEEFTLGKGHVRFFYNIQLYLKKRYYALYRECCARGYKVTHWPYLFDGIPKELMNDYQPTDEDILIIKERINTRLSKMKDGEKWLL